MRRTLAGVVALALVATAVTASAASRTYKGEITGDAKAVVALKVAVGRRGRAVTEFTVRRFPLRCEEGTAARLDRARLTGRARVSRNGRFELEASNASQRLRVSGWLRDKDEASGIVKYSGLTEFANETRVCHTTGLRWTATR